jgi:CRP/FNR family transcriptional regulator, cyclic AMP receptor protein
MSILDKHKIDFKILDRPDVPITKVAAGEIILKKGDPAKEMFLVRKGKIAIKVGEETVEEISSGGIFGEMALIDREPRSASAVAIEDSEVIPIDERLFIILVQDAPYFALDVMRVLAERIRKMNQRL